MVDRIYENKLHRFLRHLDSESGGFAIACGNAITSLYFPVALTNDYYGYTEGKDIWTRNGQ